MKAKPITIQVRTKGVKQATKLINKMSKAAEKCAKNMTILETSVQELKSILPVELIATQEGATDELHN